MSQPTESKSASAVDLTAEMDAATLVDSYADSLMDTLFEHVDQLLEGDSDTIETVLKDRSNLETDVMPLVTPLMPLAGAIDLPPLSDPAPAPAAPKLPWYRRHLPQLLSGAMVVTTAGITGLWFVFSQQQPASDLPVAPSDVQTSTDTEFLQYLQRSLDAIDAQAEAVANGTAPADMPQMPVLPDAAGPNGSLPGEPVPGSPTPGRSGPINVI
ncbi:hypothetical protein C7271_20015, partial [filamentous cyanobacterium CCP5]